MSAADDSKPGLVPSFRFTLALICFFGSVVTYMMRTALSLAIVCMVIDQGSNSTSANSTSSKCGSASDLLLQKAGEKPKPVMGEFDWDKELQGSVLGAFFYGYLLSQVLGGYLATNFGAKRVLMATMLGSTVFTLMSPVAARTHAFALILLRGGIGFFQFQTLEVPKTNHSYRWEHPLIVFDEMPSYTFKTL